MLYAVAAAVIGGTSLMGGRGRAIHGLLGGLVIGAIYNGLYLLGLDVQWQYVATSLVLLAAGSIDALSRRGGHGGKRGAGLGGGSNPGYWSSAVRSVKCTYVKRSGRCVSMTPCLVQHQAR